MNSCPFVAKQDMRDFGGFGWWITHAQSCEECGRELYDLREQLWKLLFGGRAPILPKGD